MVVDRHAPHVHRNPARGSLAIDHHGDRTALDPVPKADTATAPEPSVLESFEHTGMILQPARFPPAAICPPSPQCGIALRYSRASMSRWNSSRVPMPRCVRHSVPSRSMKKVTGSPHTGPYASWKSSRPSPTSIG